MGSLKFFLPFLFIFFSFVTEGQDEPIFLINPSFEGKPGAGQMNGPMPKGWYDCGFPTETAPDVHPEERGGAFGVTQAPMDGNSYLGMVIRSNETYERVGQRLPQPLKANTCYEFSIALSRSVFYKSVDRMTGEQMNYFGPIKLRVWGGVGYCDRGILLDETSLILHNSWKTYNLRFEPNRDINYIMFEAFYQTPTPFPNNANILLDNASPIFPVPCDIVEPPLPSEPPLAVVQPEVKKDPVPKPKPVEPQPEVVEPKILKDLDRNKLRVGETIRMDQLYFPSDSSGITNPSLPVLNEVYVFLASNTDVVVEIGGHTNNIPPHDYCDRLSTARAKAVADYLATKGIPRERLQYKGYGKRNPIESNKSAYGRKRNQRVEIKILSFNG